MQHQNTKPASGMRDFLPHQVRLRNRVIEVIRGVYERYGYEPLETPALENIETLTGKYGEEGSQLIFKVLRRGIHEQTGESDLALRYDLTVPLARVMAQYGGTLPKYFKRYQIQPVWRADKPAKGRYREFYQCDVDSMGSTSPIVEAELCAAVADVLTGLGFDDFTIRLNHRQLLSALLTVSGVPIDKHAEALVAIDKLDKVGVTGVRRELTERGLPAGVAQAVIERFEVPPELKALPAGDLDNEMILAMAERYVADEVGLSAVENLRKILALAEGTSAEGRIRIDLTLARGLSYYTGAIMEINVPDLAGSLGGGGRYDNLIGMFSRTPIPACGFSLGLERILLLLEERPDLRSRQYFDPIDLVLGGESHAGASTLLSVASRLRSHNMRIEVYPEASKATKIRKYAFDRQALMVATTDYDPSTTAAQSAVFQVRQLIANANVEVMSEEALIELLPKRIEQIRKALMIERVGDESRRG